MRSFLDSHGVQFTNINFGSSSTWNVFCTNESELQKLINLNDIEVDGNKIRAWKFAGNRPRQPLNPTHGTPTAKRLKTSVAVDKYASPSLFNDEKLNKLCNIIMDKGQKDL